MTNFRALIVGVSTLPLAACAAASVDEAVTTPTPVTTATASEASATEAPKSEKERLYALFAKADADELELSPLSAMFRGDFSRADQLGDFYTDELEAKTKQLAENNLATLASIDRGALNATDQLAYDVFKLNIEETLSEYEPEIYRVNRARPIKPLLWPPHLLPDLRKRE